MAIWLAACGRYFLQLAHLSHVHSGGGIRHEVMDEGAFELSPSSSEQELAGSLSPRCQEGAIPKTVVDDKKGEAWGSVIQSAFSLADLGFDSDDEEEAKVVQPPCQVQRLEEEAPKASEARSRCRARSRSPSCFSVISHKAPSDLALESAVSPQPKVMLPPIITPVKRARFTFLYTLVGCEWWQRPLSTWSTRRRTELGGTPKRPLGSDVFVSDKQIRFGARRTAGR